MSVQSKWVIQVTGYLQAHFYQDDGSSRPGIDCAVSLTNDSETKGILVRAYDDAVINAPPEEVSRLIECYVASLVDSGWSPDDYKRKPGELVFKR